jgi:hypothetical protein
MTDEGLTNIAQVERQILVELRRLGDEVSDATGVAKEALEMAGEGHRIAADAHQMVLDHERTLYGHVDERRRATEPGIVHVVGELATAFKDVRAVAKAGWAMLGLVGFSTAVSLFSLFVVNT